MAAPLPARSVYPRWRGELTCPLLLPVVPAGLSPLARGTQHHALPESSTPRFIPAGAGNSDWAGKFNDSGAVYPRWRGELQLGNSTVRALNGLSPLARGTQSHQATEQDLNRFIPAGAGNSPIIRMVLLTPPVYPRWRGELGFVMHHHTEAWGLSPLARGTLFHT